MKKQKNYELAEQGENEMNDGKMLKNVIDANVNKVGSWSR